MKVCKWVAICSMAAVGGCATYLPLPLTSEAVESALLPLDRTTLEEKIAALRNPLIRSARFDPAEPLTPDRASVLAIVCSPSLRAERSRQRSADAQLLQAGLLPNPLLTANVDVPVGSNTSGEVTGYGIGLDWELTAVITRGAKVEAACAASRQVQLDIIWKEWQAAQAARQAAYNVIALRLKASDAGQLAERLDRIATSADVALQRYDLLANDAAATRAAADEAHVSLAMIRRDLRDAELTLNQTSGRPPSTVVQLRDDVTLPETLSIPDVQTITANFERRRIDLVALRSGYASQESTLRASVLRQFPKISFGLVHTRDTGDFLTLGPSMSVELPLFDHNQADIAIQRATRQQLFDEYAARVFEARSDIARASALIQSLCELIHLQQAQVASLGALLAADERALDQGHLNVGTFYAAAVNFSQKQSDLTTLKLDLVHAWISLELATGARLEQQSAATRVPSEESR